MTTKQQLAEARQALAGAMNQVDNLPLPTRDQTIVRRALKKAWSATYNAGNVIESAEYQAEENSRRAAMGKPPIYSNYWES